VELVTYSSISHSRGFVYCAKKEALTINLQVERKALIRLYFTALLNIK
jgi:hypothetical protein